MSLQEYSKNIREKSNEYSEVLAAIKVLLKSKIGSESLKYLSDYQYFLDILYLL